MSTRTGASMQRFLSALKQVLEDEGGWYPGTSAFDPNPTMNGVTQSRYDQYRGSVGLPTRSVREITPDERTAIYLTYWRGVHADEIGELTAPQVFDHAVNRGIVPGIRVLQRALGIPADGLWGPQTRQKLRETPDSLLQWKVLVERLLDYREVVRRNPTKRPALSTWVGRVAGYGKRAADSAPLDKSTVVV